MRMYDLILKKRNGGELSKEEIDYFILEYTNGNVPDYQASALLMAIYFQKMKRRETVDLTMAMVNSGDILDLSKIQGIKVDKHSTGGVGDTTTLVLAPMVAALGIPVAKMSGRGLGHTGGTIDKLESFKGFSVNMTEDKFINNVNNIKIAVGAQTADLAPADKKLYALRDVTATVDNISLIASSIMSKKIAAGANAIILDVKVGEGAFMKTPETAKELAEEMVNIGKSVGRNTVAILSDMDQPLGYAIGNALEVKEAIDTLKGKGPKDLLELCLTLGSNMVILSQKANTIEEARKMLLSTIEKGLAIEKLKEFIRSQGGDDTLVDNTEKLPKAEYIIPVICDRNGYINKIHAQNIGIIASELGAGRVTKDSIIDLAVGIVLNKKRSDKVKKGDIIAYIHANDKIKEEKAAKDILNNYVIEEELKEELPLIYDTVK
ncbi:pyrimidine-nucleoside phosphorylase [Clostridium botulinum]|uniref:Pyrimidine-nucleoside phosphorylase n=2 Tax=Clostridium botulinum TaxID=1491 RepID=C1FP04_CLOBJ|nr:pyrimidine-nucleoside phosphorylase [Clostridium botulinum]ACO83688.1 pyrimidine-nucleoside phosphorylase [Clostridium botulinum A2 str. Kyoto]APC79460.1 pyrimidine-nucleoside phosphorylase family protein [Clostridium botulinum]APH21626.1 pyrimidine-nucleoside phosphorylase family protein [Clostridium botulinum]APQ67816.1 pyrimidine-nucleoside phosphorylase family protein [Clostridium botulinum]APQ75736.1 pyrimidine-nucleoside phosphorylase family protein [Clostridium botulinum]